MLNDAFRWSDFMVFCFVFLWRVGGGGEVGWGSKVPFVAIPAVSLFKNSGSSLQQQLGC